ncbi:MAG: 30S ribosomal protein S20 [Gracilibacteraceae bacterium]|jgi:small subunit ribosomal protein S20|nr:30S ribosomal protein S20 [Gracilibacteraceae bacterium]
MPNIKSAIKRVQLTKQRNARNTAARSALKTTLRRFEESVGREDSGANFRKACRALDKAGSKGLIHKNKAARKKSRLAKRLAASTKLSLVK